MLRCIIRNKFLDVVICITTLVLNMNPSFDIILLTQKNIRMVTKNIPAAAAIMSVIKYREEIQFRKCSYKEREINRLKEGLPT